MKLQEIVANDTSVLINDLAIDRVLAGEIQTRLIALGCLDPPADGDFGTVSKFVLSEFAKKAGIDYKEKIDKLLAEALLNHSADSLLPLDLGNNFISRIVKYMQLRNYWIARLPGFLNIIYIEGASENGALNDDKFNVFNDRRIVFAIVSGKPEIKMNVLATTEPGDYYTEHPLNSGGAARIAFNQYKAWRVGVHRAGKPSAHEALVQVGMVSVHRDLNKDGKRTGDAIDVGSGFAINQHSGHDAPVNKIGKASAGCLVGRKHDEHKEFMKLVKTDPRYRKALSGYKFISTIVAGDDLKNKIA